MYFAPFDILPLIYLIHFTLYLFFNIFMHSNILDFLHILNLSSKRCLSIFELDVVNSITFFYTICQKKNWNIIVIDI